MLGRKNCMLASTRFPCSTVHDRVLWSSPIAKEPFHVSVPADHRLAHQATVAIRDLHGEKVP